MSSFLVLSPSRVTIYIIMYKRLMRKRSHSPKAAAKKVFGVLHSFWVLPAPSPDFWASSSTAYCKPRAALLGKVKLNQLCSGES